MAADILTLLQTYTDTSTPQTVTPAQQTETQAEPGLFDSLVAECMEVKMLPEMLIPAEGEAQTEPEGQTLTFTGNNAFSQPVLELLAGTQEEQEEVLPQPEVAPENEDAVTWPEEKPEEAQAEMFTEFKQAMSDIKDFAQERLSQIELPVEQIAEQVITDEVLAKIPDELRGEIAQVVNDVADVLKQEDGAEEQPVMKMLGALTDRFALTEAELEDLPVPEEQEEPGDSEETTEVPENITEFAGLAGALNAQTQPVQNDAPETETSPNVLDAPARQVRQPRPARTEQPEAESVKEESPEAPDSQTDRTNFREVLENRNSENSEQDNSPDGQAQSQNQGQSFADRKDSVTRDSSPRSRRVEPRTQAERPASQTQTQRTESRSDFASFFEGVLTHRRTVARTSPQPLDLRGTENFTQAGAIRDGLTNVVRFIRADGLQKARVIVDPPALGRISVELTNGTSGVEASIKVSSEQIRQLVQDQLSQLRMNLSQQGVQVAEFTVDVQQDNSGQQQNPYQQQEQGMLNFGGLTDDEETEEFRVDLEEGLLYWVA